MLTIVSMICCSSCGTASCATVAITSSPGCHGAAALYELAYVPHNVHFLWASLAMAVKKIRVSFGRYMAETAVNRGYLNK